MLLQYLLSLLMTTLPHGDGPVLSTPCEPVLAQAFDPYGGSDEKPAKPAAKKKKKKKKQIRTEADLWGGDDPVDPDDSEPDVEEVDPDDVEEVDPEDKDPAKGKDPDNVGGWGANAERDSWGDEHRQDTKPLDPEPGVPATDPKNPKGKADGGTKSVPDPKPADAGKPDGGVAAAVDGGASLEPAALVDDPDQAQPLLSLSEDFKAPSGSLADLAHLWEQRRIHLKQRDFSLAKNDLKGFLSLRKELALGNLDLHANILIREAERAFQGEDVKRAEALFDTAVVLAPDLSKAHLARVWFKVRHDPSAVGDVFSGVIDGASAAWRNPLTRNRIQVNVILGLILGLGLFVVVFGLLQLLRHLKLFLHDFHHLFPKGVAYVQTTLLGILLILLPIFFRTGIAVTILVWLLIAWIFQNWRERALTIFSFVFLASTPLLLWLVSGWMNLPDTRVGDMVEVNRGSVSSKSVLRLKAELAESPTDETVMAVLGDYYKRVGDYSKALRYYRSAVERAPSSVILVNNLGNVYFLLNDAKKAQEKYQRATQIAPNLIEPYFNLSRAYFRMADLDKGKEAGNRAISLDSSRARALREATGSKQANHVVADLPLPEEWLTRSGSRVSSSPTDKIVQGLWRALAGTGSIEIYWVVSASGAVFFVLLLLLRRKVFSSSVCVRCGRPACRRCSPELQDDSVCGQCFHAFIRKSRVDAKSRISKEIQIRQYRRRKESLARGITFILPGAGQLIKGRTLRGALFLMLFCLVLVQVLLGESLMRDPATMGGGRDWLTLVPLLVLMAVFYAWAVLDVFRSD